LLCVSSFFFCFCKDKRIGHQEVYRGIKNFIFGMMDLYQSHQCVLVSFFHFREKGRGWAFRQMGLMHRRMKAYPEMGFYRLLGTGGGMGYSIRPNFRLYAVLTVWDDPAQAAAFLQSGIIADYTARSSEQFHLLLRPLSARGKWLGTEPFRAQEPIAGPLWLTVITRARLKWWFILPFWRRVSGVSKSQKDFPGQLFSQGIGALPWIEQATFSVWASEQDMMNFAHLQNKKHQDAIHVTRRLKGFREEIYARFQLLDAYGSFKGIRPFEGKEMPLAGILK
jgi:heme-degrading monooxygenase HmoA